MNLRSELIELCLQWQKKYGLSPAITCAISELDAALLVGMSENEYSIFMQDRTAVSRGYDFIHNRIKYQIKAHRPSGKIGSKITNAGKAKNYDWDKLIWIRYDYSFNIQEAWCWERDAYFKNFDAKGRISPQDMRQGLKL